MRRRQQRRKSRKSRRVSHARTRRQRGGGPTKSSPLFNAAYAITLDEFPERYKRIHSLATAAGIPLQPWKGVRVTPAQIDTLPPQGVGTTNFKDRTGKTFNLGVIGAFLAHRALYKHIANKPGGTLIFEDDVDIPPDFYERLAAVTAEVPADWDILFLDKLYLDAVKVSEHIMKLNRDMTGYKNWGIWAYIVKNESVGKKILPAFEHMLDVPDIQLAKFADRINMYIVRPSIVAQDQVTAHDSVVTILDVQ